MKKKNLFKCFIMLIVMCSIQSCVRSKVVDVKSPCVSGNGGPCDVRQPINTWMMKA